MVRRDADALSNDGFSLLQSKKTRTKGHDPGIEVKPKLLHFLC